jgi:UDP-N-acetylglucosamine 2-epimerase (non-hydrolysing)
MKKPKNASRTGEVALFFGTRPEIIKLSPVIRELQRRKIRFWTGHTGQHYSYEMDRVFFKELGLPEPDYALSGRSTHALRQGAHVGRILAEMEELILSRRPRVVLVQGDTNSVLAGALVSSKISAASAFSKFEVRLGHVEAGLRSYDREMPEEINRFIADHLSTYLFAPTRRSRDILIGEGIARSKVHVTGNTIVDAVLQNLKIAQNKAAENRLLRQRTRSPYFLMTLHRQENVDNPKRLALILKGLAELRRKTGIPIYFPMHPRTRKQLECFGWSLPDGIVELEPLGFFEFLFLESEARLLLTDSGGVQEEGCILGVPCVTLRLSTERPETVEAGANRLCGYESKKIVSAALRALSTHSSWKNPLGDGKASRRIIDIIESR